MHSCIQPYSLGYKDQVVIFMYSKGFIITAQVTNSVKLSLIFPHEEAQQIFLWQHKKIHTVKQHILVACLYICTDTHTLQFCTSTYMNTHYYRGEKDLRQSTGRASNERGSEGEEVWSVWSTESWFSLLRLQSPHGERDRVTNSEALKEMSNHWCLKRGTYA